MTSAVLQKRESAPRPEENIILAAFSSGGSRAVSLNLELVELEKGAVIRAASQHLEYLYFPVDAVISEMHMRDSGLSLQVAILGFEGLTGLSVLLGDRNDSSWERVFREGYAFRLRKATARREYDRSPHIQKAVMRYGQILMTQMKRTLLCSQQHTIHEQLCRYVLLASDRAQAVSMEIPQPVIASALNFSAGKTAAALFRLQMAGAIVYERGRLSIVDREKLRRLSCVCYGAIQYEYEVMRPRRALA